MPWGPTAPKYVPYDAATQQVKPASLLPDAARTRDRRAYKKLMSMASDKQSQSVFLQNGELASPALHSVLVAAVQADREGGRRRSQTPREVRSPRPSAEQGDGNRRSSEKRRSRKRSKKRERERTTPQSYVELRDEMIRSRNCRTPDPLLKTARGSSRRRSSSRKPSPRPQPGADVFATPRRRPSTARLGVPPTWTTK